MTDTPFDIDECQDKDALELYAFETFGRDIDKRKKLDALKAEVRAMEDGSLAKAEKQQADLAAADLRRRTKTPKFVRHIVNGYVFPWTPLYAGNADLEVIEWED